MDLKVPLSLRFGTFSQVYSFVAPVILSSVTDTSHVIYKFSTNVIGGDQTCGLNDDFLFKNQKTTMPTSQYWYIGSMLFNISSSRINYLYLVKLWSHRFSIYIKVVIFLTITVKGVALNCFWV